MNSRKRSQIEVGPGARTPAALVSQFRDLPRNLLGVVAVRGDVGIGHVGQRRLIAVSLRFEDQASLLGAPVVAEQPAADVQAQFERHVQTVVFPGLLRLEPGKVVDGVPRIRRSER